MTEVDVQALRRGDEFAFRTLVNTYHSTMLRLAMIYSPNRALAEEAVQETWLAVLRGLDGFSGRSSLRTWICRILVNIARRRAGVEARSLPFAHLHDDTPSVPAEKFFGSGPYTGHWNHERDDWSRLPEDRLLSQELQDVVIDAIGELPPAQREVITLRDVEGWTTAEVSELLEIEDGNQRVLLHRARSRVRQAVEDYFAPPVVAA
ncbi:MAG TPA: sigma-70 family RNA polymerase sigma factor [Pseudonocardiaceae bacterium]|nr:sigma-70 family RNA polymerase sigma factor [Pseudonocardiaceae bacterium]